MAAALELIGLPAAVLNDRHRLVAANALVQRLIPGVFEDRHERFCVVDSKAQPLFAGALTELARPDAEQSVRSIPVAAREDRSPCILHLIPVRRAAQDIFSRSVAILVVTPVERATVPSAAVVKACSTSRRQRRASRAGSGRQRASSRLRQRSASRARPCACS